LITDNQSISQIFLLLTENVKNAHNSVGGRRKT